MNPQIDLEFKPDVDHDVDFGLEYFLHALFYGLFGVVLGLVFSLFQEGSHLMQNVLRVTDVFADLRPDEKARACVNKPVEIVICQDLRLALEEP